MTSPRSTTTSADPRPEAGPLSRPTAGRPLLIGIAGGSGSGKTTVAHRVRDALPKGTVSILEHDAYYRDRPDLTFEERCLINFDHPDALETELCLAHLEELRRGAGIDAPLYDFRTHRRAAETRRVEPASIVVLEGILVFVDAGLRDRLDLKIFVDTDPDIRAFRRIRRDLEQRGRTFDSIREQYYRTVRPMHLQFVEPSKRWADLILPEGGFNHVGVEAVVEMVRGAAHRVGAPLGRAASA
jgi:uridine kinase